MAVIETSLIAGLYFLIAVLALRDLRASATLTIAYTFLSTPPLALLTVFSGWSPHASDLAWWLILGIVGNLVLFVICGYVVFFPHRNA